MASRSMPFQLLVAAAIGRLETCVVIILTGATGYYTYRGASAIEPDSDWMTKAACALFATAVAAGLYLCWRALLSQVPILSSRGRWLAAPVVAMVVVFAIGVSTFFNLTGMVGAEAVRHHMEVTLEDFSDALAAASNQAQEGLGGSSAIRINLAKFQQMAEAERAEGRNSGAAGGGAITGMLEQVATVMSAAVHDADAKTALAAKLTAEAAQGLDTIRAIVNDPALLLPIKAAHFTTEAEALRLKLLVLSRIEIVTTVRQAVAAARETVKPALSVNKTVAARQQQTIQDLAQQLQQLESLNQVAVQPVPIAMLGKPVQSITVYTAVLLHVFEYIPALIAALFIDILPLPMLFLKIIVYTDMSKAPGTDAASRYAVAELIEMRELMLAIGLQVPAQNIVPHEASGESDNPRNRPQLFRGIPNRLG